MSQKTPGLEPRRLRCETSNVWSWTRQIVCWIWASNPRCDLSTRSSWRPRRCSCAEFRDVDGGAVRSSVLNGGFHGNTSMIIYACRFRTEQILKSSKQMADFPDTFFFTGGFCANKIHTGVGLEAWGIRWYLGIPTTLFTRTLGRLDHLGSLGNATAGRRKWRRDTANDVGLCNLGAGRKGAAWRWSMYGTQTIGAPYGPILLLAVWSHAIFGPFWFEYVWINTIFVDLLLVSTCFNVFGSTWADGVTFLKLMLAYKSCWLKWVCLKIVYTPNYSHLVGIMIINH